MCIMIVGLHIQHLVTMYDIHFIVQTKNNSVIHRNLFFRCMTY